MLELTMRIIRRLLGYIFLACLSLLAIFTRRTVFVIVRPFGDLGNRLYLFANFIAFAMEHDAIILNPAFRLWRNAFVGTRPGALACYPPAPLPHFPGDHFERFVQEMVWAGESIASSSLSTRKWASISINGDECCNLDNPEFAQWALNKHVIFANGWKFLSSEYMKAHNKAMKSYFGRVIDKSRNSPPLAQNLRSDCDLVVGVLIRHGDYRNWEKGRYFFPTSTYVRWIRETKELFRNHKVGFIITGNDDIPPEGIEDIPHLFLSHRDPDTRFMLSECDYIIAPVSTFAGFAAYIGEVPIFTLSSEKVTIRKEGFKRIFNYTDMRDGSFPDDHDITHLVVSRG
jgi:hypothetical protein